MFENDLIEVSWRNGIWGGIKTFNSQDLIVDSPLYLLQISLKFSNVNLVLDQDNKFLADNYLFAGLCKNINGEACMSIASGSWSVNWQHENFKYLGILKWE